MLTLEILANFLRESGFEIQAVDSFDGDLTNPVLKHTPWQAVGVDLVFDTAGAVEIAENGAELHVWAMYDGGSPCSVLDKVELADPQCFEKVVTTFRRWNEYLSRERATSRHSK